MYGDPWHAQVVRSDSRCRECSCRACNRSPPGRRRSRSVRSGRWPRNRYRRCTRNWPRSDSRLEQECSPAPPVRCTGRCPAGVGRAPKEEPLLPSPQLTIAARRTPTRPRTTSMLSGQRPRVPPRSPPPLPPPRARASAAAPTRSAPSLCGRPFPRPTLHAPLASTISSPPEILRAACTSQAARLHTGGGMSLNRSVVRAGRDAGAGGLGVLAGPPAGAFCGFYVAGGDAKLFNNATQVVLMRDGHAHRAVDAEQLPGPARELRDGGAGAGRAQEGGRQDAAQRGVRRTSTRWRAPRLVEYWEQDPVPAADADDDAGAGVAPVQTSSRRRPTAKATDLGVKIEAQFAVGEYEIVILSAKDSTGLETWLRQEKYKIPAGRRAAAAAVRREQDRSSSSRRSTSRR